MSLVGPGALTEYGSGPRSRRSRGTVYVNDPAVGFFVAGSSLEGLNGIYIRREVSRVVTRSRAALAYEHESSGWALALVECEESECDECEESSSSSSFEWQFLAPPSRRCVLVHEGDTLIPGSGRRWKPPAPAAAWRREEEGGSSPSEEYCEEDSVWHDDDTRRSTTISDDNNWVIKTKSEEEVEDELPWQVIALLDVGMVRDLLASSRYREERVAAAKSGGNLPKLSPRSAHVLALEAKSEGADVQWAWLFVVTSSEAKATYSPGRSVELHRGDLLKVVALSGGWLTLEDGGLVSRAACEAAACPTLKSAENEDSDEELEDMYDRPVEPQLCHAEEDVVNSSEEDEGPPPPPSSSSSYLEWSDSWVVAQSARNLKVVVPEAGCWVLRRGEMKRGQIVGRDDSVLLAALSSKVDSEKCGVLLQGASRPTLVERWTVSLTSDLDAAWLGVDPTNSLNLTAAGLDAALRAAERDALFQSRLGKATRDAASAARSCLRAAREALAKRPPPPPLAGGDESAPRGEDVTPSSSSPPPPPPPTKEEDSPRLLEASLDPLDAVALGAAGARAASAATRVRSATDAETARRGCAALKQVLCDEQARVAAAVQSSATDGGGDDLCRLRVAVALAEASWNVFTSAEAQLRSARRLHPECAAPAAALGLLLLDCGRRQSAGPHLDAATKLGPHAGPDAAWASKAAAQSLRDVSRASRLKNKADDAFRRGDLEAAVERYSSAVLAARTSRDAWLLATLLSNRAACSRRLRKLNDALDDADSALRLFPNYTKALFRRAVILLELNKPRNARNAFLHLLRVQRDWPNLAQWLTRAIAQLKRSRASGLSRGGGAAAADDADLFDDDQDDTLDPGQPGPGPGPRPAAEHHQQHCKGRPGLHASTQNNASSSTTTTTTQDANMANPDAVIDHYAVLGVDVDASAAQLKRAYRLRSLRFHPDKSGGSTVAFQRVTEAFDILNDPDKRRDYDLGKDLGKKKRDDDDDDDDDQDSAEEEERSLFEQVERRYFPERYEFLPFGDPHIEKRKLRARRAKQQGKTPNWWEPS